MWFSCEEFIADCSCVAFGFRAPSSLVLESFGDWGFSLEQVNHQLLFYLDLCRVVREVPTFPVICSIAFPEGDVLEDIVILSFSAVRNL